jgi:hypothetical protein
MQIERGRIRQPSVEHWLGKRLWTCRRICGGGETKYEVVKI